YRADVDCQLERRGVRRSSTPREEKPTGATSTPLFFVASGASRWTGCLPRRHRRSAEAWPSVRECHSRTVPLVRGGSTTGRNVSQHFGISCRGRTVVFRSDASYARQPAQSLTQSGCRDGWLRNCLGRALCTPAGAVRATGVPSGAGGSDSVSSLKSVSDRVGGWRMWRLYVAAAICAASMAPSATA